MKLSKMKFPVIFLSVVLAAAVLFGGVFGTIVGVRNARAVVKYKGLTVDEKTFAYLVSVAKNRYLVEASQKGVSVSDTPTFYSFKASSGKTFGEELTEYTETFLREILIGASLFDTYSTLTKNDKEAIAKIVGDVLEYQANGSVKEFNEKTEKYGFDYKAFEQGVRLTYKAVNAMSIVYGTNGENLANYPDECNAYLASDYIHVQLLFIRTVDKFVTDENGNRVQNGEGQDQTTPLSTEEKAERAAAISTIDSAIETLTTGVGNVSMTPEMLGYYIGLYDDGDAVNHSYGYYFAQNTNYTAEFYEYFPSVIEAVAEIGMGEYRKVSTKDLQGNVNGVCYIYRYAPTDGDYAVSALSSMFGEFYSKAVSVVYARTMATLSPDVVFTDKYDSSFVLQTPLNSSLLYKKF